MAKTIFLKSLPYFTSFLAGVVIFCISRRLSEDYKSLLNNIAATFLTIPLLYFIYDRAKSFSSHKLNKELFDYVKMQVDLEVMSIVMQLIKVVHPYHKQDRTGNGVKLFLNQSNREINDLLTGGSFLGFQVFKRWTVTEFTLKKALENPLILQRLENHQTIAIINLLKSIQRLEDIHRKINDLFVPTGLKNNQFITELGTQLNARNIEYPERYLLLRRLTESDCRVEDFGDFSPDHFSDLLGFYKFNPKHVDLLKTAISDVIESANVWLNETGNEFVVDTRAFRMSA